VVALEVDVPKARSVELKGDFTDWAAVALERARSGRWELRRAMAPGIHHLIVRIDGGEWRVPPGAQSIVNEFGVPVGALLVE
jgi:1,4-alpha-glucan branching enzyme